MKLKHIIAGLSFGVVGVSTLTSCDDFLNLTPKDQLTTETFWTS